MSTNSYTYVATNGADYSATTDAIALRNQAIADEFFAEHGAELYEKQDRDARKMVYGAEYFVEVGGDFDEEGEFDVAATIEAHDINTDQYDHIEAHGIYDVSDVRAYAEIGTKDQRERARDLVLIDTRAEAIRDCRAGRAAQVAKRAGQVAPTRAEVIVAKKQGKTAKRKSNKLARRAAGASKRLAKAEQENARMQAWIDAGCPTE